MKVLVHHDASEGFADAVRAAATTDSELVFVAETDRDGLAREIVDADVVLHVLEPLDRDVLARAGRLRLVQKIGVGVNTIDVGACRELGIGVANMPGTNTQAVVEMTLALMLAARRRLLEFDRDVRAGAGFPADPRLLDAVTELSGSTVGLVGWGAVARSVARVLDAFGAKTIVHTRRAESVVDREVVGLADLLTRSDVVSLHVPLAAETTRMISRECIARMRRGAVLVNTARGGLVDQSALVAALRDGHVGAAGLDVFAEEPISPSDPLLALRNVVVAPHIAWRTRETLDRSFAIAFDNARRAMCGAPLAHEIVASTRKPS